jgi:hypothetical protein
MSHRLRLSGATAPTIATTAIKLRAYLIDRSSLPRVEKDTLCFNGAQFCWGFIRQAVHPELARTQKLNCLVFTSF